MSREEMLEELLEQGYTEQEALEMIEEDEEEQEHLAFFRFQEIFNRPKEWVFTKRYLQLT